MATDGSASAGGTRDPREDPRYDALFRRHLRELESNGFFDPEEILASSPDLGPAIVEDLTTYIQLDPSGRREEELLGTLGDFTLRRQLGRGGMGIVYEAWEGSMDRAVALKVLPAGVAADDRAFQRFLQEAKTAGKLSHPNVVPVYFTGVKEQTPFYAMELVEGETLAQILDGTRRAEPGEETPFGPKDDIRCFGQLAAAFAEVADGLQHAHSKGVTHRDIKPSNLILDRDGRLRILDFGLARLEGQESLTLSGDFVGTPLYMSPEQARRRKVAIDHRTDIYSLGATMYEALCGRPPFRGKDHADTLSQIIERDPAELRRVNSRVPRDLETIVLRCLRKSSGDRYGTAEALAQDLRRFVRGDAIEARPQSRLERWVLRVRAHRLRVAVGVAMAALAVLLVWLGWRELSTMRREVVQEYERGVRQAAMILHLGKLAGGGEAGPISPIPFFDAEDLLVLSGAEAQPLETAATELAQAERALPGRYEAPFLRARILSLLGRRDEARAALRRSLALHPGFAPAELLMRELEDGAWDVAVADPSWGGLWILARQAFREGRWEDAARSYGELVRLEERQQAEVHLGSSIEVRLGRGVAALEAGDPLSAIVDFAVVADRWPEFREPALLLAAACHRAGRKEWARRALEDLYERAASRDETAYWIVATLRVLGEYEEAIHWADAIERSTLRAQVQAALFLFSSRFTEAVSAAREAARVAPSDPLSSVLLAFALDLHSVGRSQETRERLSAEALAAAERACELRPDRGAFLAVLAFALQQRGRRAEAKQTIERAMLLEPDHFVTMYLAGVISEFQGRLSEAERIMRRAAEMARLKGRPHEEALCRFKIGAILCRDGRTRQGFGELWQAVAAFPESHAYRELGHIYRWWLYDSEAAERMHAEAARLNARDHDARGPHAEALNGIGRYDDALEVVGRVLERMPDGYEPLWIRGKTELELDRPGAALGSYVEALRSKPGFSLAAVDLVRLLLFHDVPGGDARLDGLVEGMDSVFGPGLERLDPLLDNMEALPADAADRRWFRDAGCAVLLLRAAARRDPERARELATRALRAQENYITLTVFAWCERERGEKASATRWLEQALQDPEAPLRGSRLLEGWRAELREECVSYATVDARGTGWRPPEAGAGEAGSAEELAARYARARRLEVVGRTEEAKAVFLDLTRADPSGAEPRLGLARCLEALGRPGEAEASLREWLVLENRTDDRRVSERWIALALASLAWEPADALDALDAIGKRGEGLDDSVERSDRSFLADLFWLRDSLDPRDRNAWLGILCGSSTDRRIHGRTWSRDRFFAGGSPGGWELDPAVDGVDAIFERIRHFASSRRAATMGRAYRIPLPVGRYRVTLWLSAAECEVEELGSARIESRLPDRCEPVQIEHRRGCRRRLEVDVGDGILDIDVDPGVRGLNVAAIEVERLD